MAKMKVAPTVITKTRETRLLFVERSDRNLKEIAQHATRNTICTAWGTDLNKR
jgi:hypothetical protein